MRETTKRLLAVGFGVFAASFGYILVTESVFPEWVALTVVVGGFHGAVVGVFGILGPFGPIRQRVVNVVLGLVVFVPVLVYPAESMYAFAFGTSLVLFGMLLQNAVSDVVRTDEG